MNKNDYINELDSLKADEALKNKISKLQNSAPKKEKKHSLKILLAAACVCLVFFAGINIFAANTAHKSSKDSINDGATFSSNSETAADASSLTSGSAQGRKVVKNASLSLETENYSAFMTAFEQKIEQYGAYTTYFSAQSEKSQNKNAYISVMVPAEKLDSFLEEMGTIATVGSKEINTNDITDSYSDIDGKIKALETEEKALISLLEKADKLADIISIQDRLTQVRGNLESNRAQLKNYDEQTTYSKTDIYVCEVGRVAAKSNGSFLQEVKAQFADSLYNLGNTFKNIAVFILGESPYILTALIIAAAVVIIIKTVKKKKQK